MTLTNLQTNIQPNFTLAFVEDVELTKYLLENETRIQLAYEL